MLIEEEDWFSHFLREKLEEIKNINEIYIKIGRKHSVVIADRWIRKFEEYNSIPLKIPNARKLNSMEHR